MSKTEIYIYTKKRKSAILVGTAPNAFSGSVAVWASLSKKYIGCEFNVFDTNSRQNVWGLYKDKRLTRNERIVLTSTFDSSSCKPSGIKELVNALREVNHSLLNDKGNLSIQADVIEQVAIEHKDIYCVAILGTDVIAFEDEYKSKESTWDIIEDVNKTEASFVPNQASSL